MHAFIHSSIHFNANYVTGSARGSEDSGGPKEGPPGSCTWLCGWQRNPRMLETYPILIPLMSPAFQILLLKLHSKQVKSQSWKEFVTLQSLIVLDSKARLHSMLDLFIYQQTCLWIIWFPKIKSTLKDKLPNTKHVWKGGIRYFEKGNSKKFQSRGGIVVIL